MTVFDKDGIEVTNLLRTKHPVQEPTEPTYEVENTGETDAQSRIRKIRNQEKRVARENNVRMQRKKHIFVKIYNGMTHTQVSEATYSYVLEQMGV